MAWGKPDVYHQPEAFGLQPVAEIDYSDGNYVFDTRAVWKHEASGNLYTARDSGCSCPSPFEDYTSIDSLEPADVEELRREAGVELTADFGVYVSVSEVQDFISAVRAAAR